MSFNLVQRLNEAPDGQPCNPISSDRDVSETLQIVGAGVDLDYMGRTEFEPRGGASLPNKVSRVAESGNRLIRVVQELKVVTGILSRPSYEEEVHFIATAEQKRETIPRWHEWAGNPDKLPNSLVPTGYFLDDAYVDYYKNTLAWWVPEEDLIWARERDVAERILGAFVRLSVSLE